MPKFRGALSGALRDPVVWIFVLAGTAEILARDPRLHTTLLFVVAAVLVADTVRHGAPRQPVAHRDAPTRRRRSIGWTVALAAAVVGYAAIVGSFQRFTYPVTVGVGIPAAVVLVWSWRAPGRRRPEGPPNRLGMLPWLAVFVGVALCELVSFVLQPSLTTNSAAHPTVSALADPIFVHHLGRSAGIGLWAAVGWFLVGR